LLEKAVLADEIFRFLLVRQEGVDQVDRKGFAAAMSSPCGVDYRQMTVSRNILHPLTI
jgi:hypothetical protein